MPAKLRKTPRITDAQTHLARGEKSDLTIEENSRQALTEIEERTEERTRAKLRPALEIVNPSSTQKTMLASDETASSNSFEFDGLPCKLATGGENEEVRLIAFYLPQFHPVPENDKWWGKGFTEWPGVANARSLFGDHYQPHIPADLGFYDLRVSQVREEQAELAKQYGISGFCYHYYWFSGRKILDQPISEVLRSGSPDFPFCLCWANESWSRRWDGSESEVLMHQEHDLEIDKTFIDELCEIFRDKRYITVNGAPLILIYRVGILPDPKSLFAHWRDVARRNGFPDLHIVMAETFGLENPYQYGCDAAVEFPPHKTHSSLINHQVNGLVKNYVGNIYSYKQVVLNDVVAPAPLYARYKCVMPNWDNTPRRGPAGNVFHGSSPELYELWLRETIRHTKQWRAPDSRLIFINAWNEWGEGAHLEPDLRNGRSYLEATRRALAGLTSWQILTEAAKVKFPEAVEYLEEIRAFLSSYDTTTKYLSEKLVELQGKFHDGYVQHFVDAGETDLEDVEIRLNGLCYIERINRFTDHEDILVRKNDFLQFEGWAFVPGIEGRSDPEEYITLLNTDGKASAVAKISNRTERADVVAYHSSEEARWSGISLTAKLNDIAPGFYTVAVDTKAAGAYYRSVTNRVIHVVV